MTDVRASTVCHSGQSSFYRMVMPLSHNYRLQSIRARRAVSKEMKERVYGSMVTAFWVHTPYAIRRDRTRRYCTCTHTHTYIYIRIVISCCKKWVEESDVIYEPHQLDLIRNISCVALTHRRYLLIRHIILTTNSGSSSAVANDCCLHALSGIGNYIDTPIHTLCHRK